MRRRECLRMVGGTVAAGGLAGLAGCSDPGGDDGGGGGGYAFRPDPDDR